MNFDTPQPVQKEKTVAPVMTAEIPTPEPANLESEAGAVTTEMLASAQKNREKSVEKAGFTLEELKTKYPGVFKFLRMTGLVVSLFMASDAAYAGGPVVRGPVVRDAVIHAAKPVSHGVIHAPAPINHGISHAPVVRGPGEKTMKTVITTNQATPSNFKETPPSTNTLTPQATGNVYKDSSGNVSGNVRGGIDLTRG